MWYARIALGFFVYYLTAGVGALCTWMMYRSHGGTGYLMSYAWTILEDGIRHCGQWQGH